MLRSSLCTLPPDPQMSTFRNHASFSRWAENFLTRVVQKLTVKLAFGRSHSDDVPDVFLSKPSRAACLLRIKTDVFLDQTPCNFVWDRCSSTDCASLRQACNVVALPLALSVLANIAEPNVGKEFLAIAECCFLSWVLRHTRLPVFVGVAEKLLKAILTHSRSPRARNSAQSPK